MSLSETVYELGVSALRPLVSIAAPLSPKLRRGVQGRRAAVDRISDWAAQHRDHNRALVWVHAPSAGESLMAQAIIEQLRALRPGVQVAFTFFSPSAERVAQRVGADIAEYLPWDTKHTMQRAMSALRPSAIAFVRTEIWPTLVRTAVERDVRLCLVNAVLSAKSSRLSAQAKWFLESAYKRLDAVGAIAIADAERFPRLGVSRSHVRVTGDARFDQAHARACALDLEQPLLARLRDPQLITIVAGSTWPTDEQELLPTYASARKGCPLRLIIAPHEPDAGHLRSLEQRLQSAGLKAKRLSEVEDGTEKLPEVVVVDRVGILADLYAVADIAYVGGGFHDAGLHSVLEPAALGVPTIFGPRHGNAREADELAGKGGGFVASDGPAFGSLMLDLANRRSHRESASRAARGFVVTKLGGAKRNAEMIAELLG